MAWCANKISLKDLFLWQEKINVGNLKVLRSVTWYLSHTIFELVHNKTVLRYTWNRWKFTLKKYTGKQNVTSLGFECENWDDEQFQSHRYKPLRANHNFCRDPSGLNGKPWCYVKSKQKWDYCPIDFCYDHDGSRLEFNVSSNLKGRDI